MKPKDQFDSPLTDDRDRAPDNIADEGETAGPLGREIGTFDTDNVGADMGPGGIGAPTRDRDEDEH